MKRAIRTRSAPDPAGPYSQGIVAGPFLFVAGQTPRDPESGRIPEGIEAQTHQGLRNVGAILEAAGFSFADVVKATVHLADMSYFDAFNQVYRGYFPEPLPARTTVASGMRGILVEIDVVAYRETAAGSA